MPDYKPNNSVKLVERASGIAQSSPTLALVVTRTQGFTDGADQL
jgi:hypothetical protein